MAGRLPQAPQWLRWSAVIALAALLLVGSMAPVSSGSEPAETDEVLTVPSEVGGLSPFVLAHFLGYATLAGTLAYALADVSNPSLHLRLLALAFLATVVYSIAIEGLQGLVSYRSFSYHDMVLNALGAGLGVAGWALVDRLAE